MLFKIVDIVFYFFYDFVMLFLLINCCRFFILFLVVNIFDFVCFFNLLFFIRVFIVFKIVKLLFLNFNNFVNEIILFLVSFFIFIFLFYIY